MRARHQHQARPVASPAVRLEGNPDLIAVVKATLAERGILTVGADGDDSGRGAVNVKLERRGARIVVFVDVAGGPTGREVTDARTAATVIESQVRVDVEAPLLADRPIASAVIPSRRRAVAVAVAVAISAERRRRTPPCDRRASDDGRLDRGGPDRPRRAAVRAGRDVARQRSHQLARRAGRRAA